MLSPQASAAASLPCSSGAAFQRTLERPRPEQSMERINGDIARGGRLASAFVSAREARRRNR